ncbi:hypothetical protein [Psychroserpens algicola]|uniref:Uncharacterized protein n=1 Tax=Psychroserpens algicola TaxID=1719034 RepID=A0ABT0HD31_9FLAO|nr:hypothetical protein [Psychroserpens algicola]MCK8482283.1 hypothetical protein [Psychroserpens algicola]
MKRTRRNNNKNRFTIVFPILTIVGLGVITMFSSFYEESWLFDWNGINGSIKDSISVYKYRSISSGVGGNGRAMPEEIESRIWIMKNATESELIKLTEFPNGNIKAIAYEGLIRKQSFDKKTEYILKAIRDTTHLVYYQSGCIGTGMSLNKYVSHYVLNIADDIPPFPPDMTPDLGLSDNDKEKILKEYKKYPSFEN